MRVTPIILIALALAACDANDSSRGGSSGPGGGYGAAADAGSSGPGGGYGAAADAGAPGWGGGGGAGGQGAQPGPPLDEPDPPPPGEEDTAWPPATCPDTGRTQLHMSADDSNSQASPVVVRALVDAGRLVPPQVIRTYEFLNYADFAYPAPEAGLAIYPELRAAELDGQYDLQIGLRAADLPRAAARPLDVVLVLDSSGSMAGPPMQALRAGVQALLAQLGPADTVSVVRLDAAPRVLLEDGQGGETTLDAFADALVPNGSTDLEGALRPAYQLAEARTAPDRMARVVLFSDGGANVGTTAREIIAGHAGDARSEGVYLVGVGLGEGFDDSMLDAVTDVGKGAFLFVDGPDEARRMFEERFVQLLELAALDVQVQLDLPPQWQLIVFHGEEVSGDPAEVRPQNLAPSDQMVFNQLVGTCAPDAVDGSEAIIVRVEYTDALTGERERLERSVTVGELLAAPADNLVKGKALVAFAEGVKDLWALRRAPADDITAACDTMRAALGEGDDPDLEDARRLAARYCGTVLEGEQHPGACDCAPGATFAQALGACDGGPLEPLHNAQGGEHVSYGAIPGLYESGELPREGCQVAALSTGQIGEAETIPGRSRDCEPGVSDDPDPQPAFSGDRATAPDDALVCDLSQVRITLTAPADAQSFSFDFRFFSAEFPEYIGSPFNDTFYAILQADSTNGGAPTNISFDAAGREIEINNDYFANPFHPCSELHSGFVRGASTCWLRTSWPIAPGETFTLTFSVHDEGDAIYSSTVLLDNLRFHPWPAVGMTDPLN